jgi:AraC-like DNA-binding protein
MLNFYRKAFLGLVALTALLAYICIERFFVSDALFPAQESAIPWKLEALNDAVRGGSSVLSLAEDVYGFDYEYQLTEDARFPFVAAIVAFAELKNAKKLVDLSGYSTASFRVKCAPHNVLTFYVHSFDEKVTKPGDFFSYRMAEASFSCYEEWSEIEIDLRHLTVPVWWLESANIDVSDHSYRLDQVLAIAFVASQQAPVNAAKIKIGELTLRGRDWRYAWAGAGFLVVVWAGFIGWLFKQYTRSLKDKLKQDRPLIAYQQLSIKPHRDKEKDLLLRFMATEYKNPDMSLEFAVARLGINRTKINALLKVEVGMTFSGYLNKLRLTEAARLLAQRGGGSIAEIALLAGYNNISYFRKLFKSEYGCTPSIYRPLGAEKD